MWWLWVPEASFEGCLHSVQAALVLCVRGRLADDSADNGSFSQTSKLKF